MEYTFKSLEKGITVISVSGRLDAITYQEFEEKILAVFNEEKKGLIIDFSKVDYVSSAGLRAMLRAVKKKKETRGALALFGLNANITELFKIAGFYPLFEIFSTEQEAVDSVEKQLK